MYELQKALILSLIVYLVILLYRVLCIPDIVLDPIMHSIHKGQWESGIKSLSFRVYGSKVSDNKDHIFQLVSELKKNPMYSRMSSYNYKLPGLLKELSLAKNNTHVQHVHEDIIKSFKEPVTYKEIFFIFL